MSPAFWLPGRNDGVLFEKNWHWGSRNSSFADTDSGVTTCLLQVGTCINRKHFFI